MTLLRPFVTALTISFVLGSACTPSNSAGRQPTLAGDSAADPARTTAPPPVIAQDDSVEPPPAVPGVVPIAPPVMARPVAVPRPSGPYGVRIVDDASRNLPTYAKDGRTYVMGSIGSRYQVALSNPTAQRVEAVVSVDGLDAMDGQPANYATKRGYIIQPYGTATIDGFRTSMDQVATFRFSSVADSYAGRLGEARDVGVIGVAFFPERPPPVVARVDPPYVSRQTPYPSPARRAPGWSSDDLAPPGKNAAPAPPTAGATAMHTAPAPEERRGLGTEFGEARDSRIYSTQFDRANPGTPRQVVAIRYNDRAGLVALGIRIAPVYPSADLTLRETAEPFRGNGFAQPPP